MIKELHLHQIGPVADLEAEFGPRLNLVTGDNGLGKTFLLDACWYALTRTWADAKPFYPFPTVPKKDPPSIKYTIIGKTGKNAENQADYRFSDQTWKGQQARPPMPGLVIYARIDGGFSVWDPARNYWRDGGEGPQRPSAYQFSKKEVWEGLEEEAEGQKTSICNGLLRDVETWRLKGNGAFQLLQKVLETLSSGEEETLRIGEGVRVRLDDAKDIPTLTMPYGAVPVTQAAAGMRRVLALAYLLVWAWEEHRRVSQLKKEPPTNRIVLLFDEVEAHLHPKWQRVFLPSLMEVVKSLLLKGSPLSTAHVPDDPNPDEAKALLLKARPQSVQIIATTHAPMVLASIESVWSMEDDRLFDFNLVEGNHVEFGVVDFARHGSVANWLTSGSFDLQSSYAVTAEAAMKRADAFMLQHPQADRAPRREAEEIHNQLVRALGGDDEYWPYWLPYYQAARRAA